MKVKYFLLILFAFILIPFAGMAYELTLFAMPSLSEINWNTPRGLARCALTNNLTLKHKGHKHAIGHVFIELKGPNYYRVTGSAPIPENTMKDKVLKKGYGLGILFTGVEGNLEKTENLLSELPKRYQTGRIGFITFRINEKTFNRLVKYVTEYEKRGYGKIYNGLNKPRDGLGAGCSAFGMSFLELAGILHPYWAKTWPVNVKIPQSLIGGPLTGNQVPLVKILKRRTWAKDNEPFKLLKLYEPYRIFEWICKTYDKEKAEPTHNVGLMQRGKAKGLIYDCRHVKCPTDPIFKKPTDTLK